MFEKNILMAIFLIVSSLLAFSSCSKKNRYAKEQIIEMSKHYEFPVEVIIPKEMTAGVRCSDYGEGCVSGFTMKTQELEMNLVEFKTEALAIKEAKRLHQFYARNWVFDDVKGEPALEKFVRTLYGALEPAPFDNQGK